MIAETCVAVRQCTHRRDHHPKLYLTLPPITYGTSSGRGLGLVVVGADEICQRRYPAHYNVVHSVRLFRTSNIGVRRQLRRGTNNI